MQLQTYEGYWENDRFYPIGQPVHKTGKQKVILTFLNEPVVQQSQIMIAYVDEVPTKFASLVEEVGMEEAQRRISLLSRLKEAVALSADETMLDFPNRGREMKAPVLFDD